MTWTKVVAKLLAKDPRNRYQNLLALAIDLDRVKAKEPIELGVDRPGNKPETAVLEVTQRNILIPLAILASVVGAFCIGLTVGTKIEKPHVIKTDQNVLNNGQ